MDRRSWLWRRKSSEKSPGETESTGSMSSHSERFSDDQACPTQSSVSPDISSKVVATDEEINDSMKILSEKLSNALLDISAKEELVKQHAKVAEEAVSGWEKAENEVLALKKKLEASGHKNSALENRVGHLDGALKECVRQLRQAREDQEQKIQEAFEKKTCEWESRKSELESQLAELQLQAQLQTVKNEAPASVNIELCQKLEALEKENSTLKLELLSRAEEMEIRILERDLSTQAAETASKQHLEGIKKLAKLEAECRRLKIVVKKTSPMNDFKSYTATSSYLESITDSQSDSGERLLAIENDIHSMRGLEMNECEPSHSGSWASTQIKEWDQFKNGKSSGRNLIVSSVEINLMDDFLEMERLAALPGTDIGNRFDEAEPVSGQMDVRPPKSAYEALIRKISELEEKLKKTEAENLQLEMALTGSKKQVETLQHQLNKAEGKLLDVQKKALTGSKKQLETLQNQLKKAEGKLLDSEKIKADKRQLEMDLTGSKKQVENLQTQLKEAEEMLEIQKKAVTGSQKQLEKLQDQLMNAERMLLDAEKMKAEKFELEMALTRTTNQLEKSEVQLKDAEKNMVELRSQITLATDAKRSTEEEVKAANMKREAAESQLQDVEEEIKSLLSKIVSLEEETEKERSLSAKNLAKCKELQDEILKMKNEIEHWNVPSYNGDLKIMQEKELAVAAKKFAECQKTIASLGQQLKSLATFEDQLLDSDTPLDVSRPSPTKGSEPWKMYPGDLKLSRRGSEAKNIVEYLNSSRNGSDLELSSPLLTNPIMASERSQNGVGNFLNVNKGGRSELSL